MGYRNLGMGIMVYRILCLMMYMIVTEDGIKRFRAVIVLLGLRMLLGGAVLASRSSCMERLLCRKDVNNLNTSCNTQRLIDAKIMYKLYSF